MALTKASGSWSKVNVNEGNRTETIQWKNVYNPSTGRNDVKAVLTSSFASAASTSTETTRTSQNTSLYRTLLSVAIPLPYLEQSWKRTSLSPWRGKKLTRSVIPTGQLNSFTTVVTGGFDDPGTNNWPDWYGSKTSLGPITAAQRQAVDDQARTKVLLKIKNQKINVGQAVAESRLTARLISENAYKIAMALRALKRGNIAEAARDLGVAPPKRAIRRINRQGAGANAATTARQANQTARDSMDDMSRKWLELQYGWKPLLNDVYGAAEHLAQRQSKTLFSVATASASISVPFAKVYPLSANSQGKAEGTATYKRKYTVRHKTSNPGAQELSQLGISNPALIAWELMPWSFVIDWFIPVGNFLSSLDATAGVVFHEGCVSTIETLRSQNTYSQFGSTDVSQYDGEISQVLDRKLVTRGVLGSFPTPALPTFKNPVSTEHAFNALALLKQLRK